MVTAETFTFTATMAQADWAPNYKCFQLQRCPCHFLLLTLMVTAILMAWDKATDQQWQRLFADSGLTFHDVSFMYYGAPVDGQILAAGDIDGDGDLDLAVSFSAMDWGDYTYSSRVKIFINNSAPPTSTDGTLTAAPGVIEPVGLPASADTVGEAVNVFDFTLRDGGGGDNVAWGSAVWWSTPRVQATSARSPGA